MTRMASSSSTMRASSPIRVGDQIIVTYKKDGDKMVCSEIRAKRS